MGGVEHGQQSLPVASGIGEPLSYSREIASDMPWVLRFVGCFIILQGLETVLKTLPYAGSLATGTIPRSEIVRLALSALPILLGMGVYARHRLALPLAAMLCLCQSVFYLPFVPFRVAVAVWLADLPIMAVQALLHWAIYRRAHRSGMLEPGRAIRSPGPPSGDDILWLCRCVAVSLLPPAIALAMLVAMGYAGNSAYSALKASYPALRAVMIAQAGAFAALSIGILLGRYRLLVVAAAVTAVSYLARHVALQWDIARSSGLGSTPIGSDWRELAPILLVDLLTAGFYLVLYRKARRRA